MADFMKRISVLSVITFVLIGVIIGFAVTMRTDSITETVAVTESGLPDTGGEVLALQEAFINVAEKVGPAVVSIVTETTHRVPARRYLFGPPRSFFDDDFFRDFFGEMPEREFKQQGLGSGVIIDRRGYIITNDHVIGEANKITVILPDGRKFEAELKGSDPRSDLAVIKIKADNLPAAELGDSDLVKTGQWAVAIGNPFGFAVSNPNPTVTVGVVSALHRQLPLGRTEGRNYIDLIQTDAAINPGNSGGPLCDLNGSIIGLNVAIFSTTGGYQGIGFAIPAATIKYVLDDLVEGRDVSYGWIGVTIQELSYEMAEYFGLEEKKGVIVIDILKDGPAAKAGIKPGDVIISCNGEKVDSLHSLLKYIGEADIGSEADIGILRDGRKETLSVEIARRPSETEIAGREEGQPEAGEEAANTWRGMTVVNITDELIERYGVSRESGVLIVKVEPASPAYEAGLSRGLIIKAINRIAVRDASDFKNITAKITGKALLRTNKGYVIVGE